MVEKFTFRGFTFDEIKKMELKEFIKLLPAEQRRSIIRGFTPAQKRFLKRVEETRKQIIAGKTAKPLKTHCRDIVILPNMVGLTIGIYNGKEFLNVEITPDKLGHRLGEFALTRKKVQHSAPGVGATRGSTFVPIK